MIESTPPLQQHYARLLQESGIGHYQNRSSSYDHSQHSVIQECELPLIDLEGLKSCDERERLACSAAICKAASKWGFFQVSNHGVDPELLRKMKSEQVRLFDMPFEKKAACRLLNNSYRWGTPTATCPNQFSWSEAFHISLTKISEPACWGEFNSLRYQDPMPLISFS